MKAICLFLLAFATTGTLCAQSSAQKDSLHTGPAKADTSDVRDMIFTRVEVESEFPGGWEAWGKFLNKHLVYPRDAVRKRIQGTVVVQFIVGIDGKVSDVEAISGPQLLRKAAVKMMAKSPRWIPATQNGRKVRSYKKQPVVFRLERG